MLASKTARITSGAGPDLFMMGYVLRSLEQRSGCTESLPIYLPFTLYALPKHSA
jgi:hypothetical protein